MEVAGKVLGFYGDSVGGCIYGSRNTKTQDINICVDARNKGALLNTRFGASVKSATTVVIGEPFCIRVDSSGLTISGGVNATYAWTTAPGEFQSGTTNYLFVSRPINNYISITQLYYCKTWRSGELIQHLVPVRRLSDGVVMMYDLVENEEYEINEGELLGGEGLGQYI